MEVDEGGDVQLDLRWLDRHKRVYIYVYIYIYIVLVLVPGHTNISPEFEYIPIYSNQI